MSDVMESIPKNSEENIMDSKPQIFEVIKRYIILPFKEGIYGFALVFSVILMVKLLSYVLNINETFELDFMDVLLSLVGFLFMFLIYFLKKLQK